MTLIQNNNLCNSELQLKNLLHFLFKAPKAREKQMQRKLSNFSLSCTLFLDSQFGVWAYGIKKI